MRHRTLLFVIATCSTVIGGAAYSKDYELGSPYRPEVHGRKGLNPFQKYVRVAEALYVYDRSQFTTYVGPILSPQNADPKGGVVKRRRLGSVAITPNTKVNVDLVVHPMHESYEFLDIASGKIIHEFSYFATSAAPLLVTTQGVIYEYATIDSLCWGPVTRKFEFTDGAFVEVTQPMLFINAETEILRDMKLHQSENPASPVVSTLRKGMKAVVLSYEQPDRFLLRTPLGLTGWFVNDSANTALSITLCN